MQNFHVMLDGMYGLKLLNCKFIFVNAWLLEAHEFQQVAYQYQNGIQMNPTQVHQELVNPLSEYLVSMT